MSSWIFAKCAPTLWCIFGNTGQKELLTAIVNTYSTLKWPYKIFSFSFFRNFFFLQMCIKTRVHIMSWCQQEVVSNIVRKCSTLYLNNVIKLYSLTIFYKALIHFDLITTCLDLGSQLYWPRGLDPPWPHHIWAALQYAFLTRGQFTL